MSLNIYQDGASISVIALGKDQYKLCQTGGGYQGEFDPDGLVYYEWIKGQEVVTDELGGGDLTSAPAVSKSYVAARGKDGNIWYKNWKENGWQSSWSSVPSGVLNSTPGICEEGGNVHIFATGKDDQLWHTYKSSNANWIPWRSLQQEGVSGLPGGLSSKPSVVSSKAGRIDIVARGSDNAVWHLVYDQGWSQWYSIGGDVISAPTSCWWDTKAFHVFVRGKDGHFWHKYFDWESPDGKGRWYKWNNDVPSHPKVSGSSAPDAIFDSSGCVDIFARGAGAEVWNIRWTQSTGWQEWKPISISNVFYPIG
jgi:hypothetical protein